MFKKTFDLEGILLEKILMSLCNKRKKSEQFVFCDSAGSWFC